MTIGHNNPPDVLDDALAPFADAISEAEAWLDGSPVENKGQMQAVDALIKSIKQAKKAVEGAEESEAKPIYDQWKAAKARFKPTLDDLDRITKGLVAAVDGYKRKLAAEQAEAERQARAEAERKMREAKEAAMQANAADLDAQRQADALRAAAEQAAKDARAIASESVKGLRTETLFEVTDYRALINWIARNDKDAIVAFCDEWARKNHKTTEADGLKVWQEKRAF